ncbi:MAG: hypothetical protein ACJ8BF_11160 [Gemmatimonadales bacterium]
MKRILLALNHGFFFFGTTLYVGVLWALHFFWFPSWRSLTAANYYDQFIPQTSTATRFFTVVVPLMFLTGAIMVWREWRTRLRWLPLGALLCLAAATFVGTRRIIPVNRILASHITDQAQVTALLQRWMELNDIRWVLLTLSWLLLMIYFFLKGNTLDAIAGETR